MDQRPWWERLLDRDNSAAPVLVVLLLLLAIGFVLVIGPMLDRRIEGKEPASFSTDARAESARIPLRATDDCNAA